MEPLQPIHIQETKSIKETLDIVESGIHRLVKTDPFRKYRDAAEWGFNNGLLRVKSESEINLELRKKPWLTVNKLIQTAENNDTNDPNHSTYPDRK